VDFRAGIEELARPRIHGELIEVVRTLPPRRIERSFDRGEGAF
jgi:hypothetical protein